MSIFESYKHCFSQSKTIQFSLIPEFETADNLEKFNIINEDQKKAEKYKVVKEVFDKCHKMFIAECLDKYSTDWEPLFETLTKAQQEKDTKDFEAMKKKYQKDISNHFKKDPFFEKLKPEAIVSSVVKNESTFSFLSEQDIEIVKCFNRFATYFEGYRLTRENIYSSEISTSIAYRIVEDNFPKFVSNIRLYDSLSDELKQKFDEELKVLTDGYTLDEIFSVNGFNLVLSQKGIEFYNTILGGVTEDETTKLQGLNELCNLECQKKPNENKKIKFTPLYKQILSDRDTLSFLPQKFESDKQLLDSVKEYSENLLDFADGIIPELKQSIDQADCERIFVDKKQISYLSQIVFDNNWSEIKSILYDNKIADKSCYNLSVLNELCNKDLLKITFEYFEKIFEETKIKYNNCQPELDSEKIVSFDSIKSYLDSIQLCEKTLKIFVAKSDSDKDPIFYSSFDEIYDVFRANISLYNKVRNFATQKPYSTEKFKLNFECPTLADGWDKNKETSNNTVLFIKDGFYYIGIFNAKAKMKLTESDTPSDGDYKKMVYKLLPGPNKMLPKAFFSKKGLETYGENKYIHEGYNYGLHKKGDNFDLKFCHDLIDYFKDCISRHPDWSKFGFEFSDTQSYKDTSDFYNEITKQAYKISFSYVSEEEIKKLVSNGNMFLFKLYNKDYSSYSTGNKNLFTLYWEEIFTEENLKNPVYKLNGQAELFYRPASIRNPFIHKQGTVLINKNDNGKPVDEDVYLEAKKDADNGMSVEDLKNKYPMLTFKCAKHDIVKDRRYSKPSFSFHVPITMNYAVDNKYPKFNESVLNTLQNDETFNIIGIDRGERNLIYISLINQNGRILGQKSYNCINGVDYHSKLDKLEKERDDSRKNWKNIDSIKEVKEGYLSAVVKEICDMMVKHNAVLIMEDLNFGFKRGRFHFEKQVYQKFEKQLIDKLNFFVDKTKDRNDDGGIRNAYQLTSKFESFKKLGKQSGFLFYVPASYTSKIDPLTGFVNLFTSKQLNYHSIESSKEFISGFDSISYDEKYGFRFDFSYSNFDLFKTDYTDNWSVYSCGDGRIAHTKKDGYDSKITINVTQELKDLFKQFGIEYFPGEDFKDKLLTLTNTEFFKKFIWLFKTTVQLRYEDEENDFILSPVMSDGRFFDSRTAKEDEPQDGDANGAYHIALQGLRMLKRIENGKIKPDEKNKQAYNWFEFTQSKPYKF